MAPEADDDRLIDDALAGRPEAFGSLVSRYQDRLYHGMVNILGSADDARDVVQDAFVQAFLKLEGFRRTSGFYTWVYRIAFNAAATRSAAAALPSRSMATRCRAAAGWPIQALRRITASPNRSGPIACGALRSLDEEFRTVLVMREIDDCSYETIADVLDLPIGTVRSRLHRARAQMRELLKEALEIEKE